MSKALPLRVACLLPAPDAPAWMLQTLQDIQNISGAVVTAVGVDTKASVRNKSTGLQAVLDAKWFALSTCPLQEQPLPSGTVMHKTPQPDLQSPSFDLILDLAGWTEQNQSPKLRYGVWRYYFVKDGQDIITLLKAEGIGEKEYEKLLYSAKTAISPLSATQNKAQLYWKSCWFAGRALRNLIRYAGFGGWAKEAETNGGRELESRDFEAYKNIFSLVKFRLLEYRGRRDVWWIRLYKGDVGLEEVGDRPFYDIKPPQDRFWADPLVLDYQGESWLFMEEFPYDTDKGCLSVCRIKHDGSCTPPVPIVQEDWHLSYPFVFEWRGTLYLIPESSAAKTVDLYECTEFPHRWTKKKSLLSGMHFADNTLLYKDGLWWMFTCAAQDRKVHNRDELFLFYSDDLVNGEWVAHPQNPVVSNSRTARSAGKLIQKDGKWYRPSQDNSLRYGYGLVLNEIETWDIAHYREKAVHQFHYDLKVSEIAGVHTYNQSSSWTAIDLLRWEKK